MQDLNFDNVMKLFRKSFKKGIVKTEKQYILGFEKEIPNEFKE